MAYRLHENCYAVCPDGQAHHVIILRRTCENDNVDYPTSSTTHDFDAGSLAYQVQTLSPLQITYGVLGQHIFKSRKEARRFLKKNNSHLWIAGSSLWTLRSALPSRGSQNPRAPPGFARGTSRHSWSSLYTCCAGGTWWAAACSEAARGAGRPACTPWRIRLRKCII